MKKKVDLIRITGSAATPMCSSFSSRCLLQRSSGVSLRCAAVISAMMRPLEAARLCPWASVLACGRGAAKMKDRSVSFLIIKLKQLKK